MKRNTFQKRVIQYFLDSLEPLMNTESSLSLERHCHEINTFVMWFVNWLPRIDTQNDVIPSSEDECKIKRDSTWNNVYVNIW